MKTWRLVNIKLQYISCIMNCLMHSISSFRKFLTYWSLGILTRHLLYISQNYYNVSPFHATALTLSFGPGHIKCFGSLSNFPIFFFRVVLWPNADNGLLILQVSRSQRRTTAGITLLDEWSARSRDLYLTTHNSHNGQRCMPPAVFEPAIPAAERSRTHGLAS